VIEKAPAASILATIGEYEVIDKLGEGGMGAVYRARQTSLDRIVALKVLPEQAQLDPDSVSRFEREARVAARLTHPNLVRVYASGTADGTHFIAMELVEGENLHQRLKRGAMPIPEALRICADVARALQCGWDTAQLIHRDIKPSNIYLAHDGMVKLGDLGIAKSLLGNTTGLTQTGTMMGTPHYISPEQARAEKNLDFRADIYSLGCTLFQCLTGRTPYNAADALTLMHQHLTAPPPALLKALPGAPMILARLVGKMLKKSKHERHASYADLIAEMDFIREQIESGTTNAGPSRVVQAWKEIGDTPSPGRVATPQAPASAVAARQSKLPLYGAIAAGVLVLIGLAFLITRPKKPRPSSVAPITATTKTQSTPSSTPAIPSSTAATISSPGWQPLVSEAEWKKSVPGREFVDGLLHLTKRALDATPPSADSAIRARIHLRHFDGYPEVHLRSTQAGKYLATLNQSTSVDLIFYPAGGGPHRRLGKYQLPQRLKVGDIVTLELRAQGSHFTVLLNDKVIIEADDSTVTEPGKCGLYTTGDAWFESAEVRALPATAQGEAIKGTSSVPPDRSQPLTAAPAAADAWQLLLSEAEWRALGPVKDGFVEVRAFQRRRQSFADGAIRARFRRSNGSTQILVARDHPVAGHYKLGIDGRQLSLSYWRRETQEQISLAAKPMPRAVAIGDVVQLELRAVGSHLTALADDVVVLEADDARLTDPGEWGFSGNGEWQPVEVRPLSAATPATATKGTPFINSLGMKFVPVPITGGPTAGQRVLFSVWETRVQDYEVFAKETKRAWSKPDFEQDATHPAVKVSWEDAQAFCAWLTERERKAGKLSVNEIYRLPSDHEWSCAVGIGEREDAAKTPEQKDQKISDVFPWGVQWPPPEGSGNYWSEELRAVIAAGKLTGINGELPGYPDGFATTSPVGSYAANRFGLHDLGGNVWEWCEDWYDGKNEHRVLRGASWSINDRGSLLAAERTHDVPGNRYRIYGYRCVVAMSAR
jgi:serine/threonine protein kinase